MIFRVSEKLGKKIYAGKLKSLPLDANPLADWSAHLFFVKRTQCIIIYNTSTLYSCVMYGSGITDTGRFIERAAFCIRSFMEWDGKEFIYVRFMIPIMGSVQFAKPLDRSTIGSVNELVKVATRILQDETIAPCDVGTELNQILLSSIATKDDLGYCTPYDAFKRIV